MKIIVFTGPTISASEAAHILNATYLPPVKQGDFIGVAYNERPDIIAIIDGIIFSEMPVWHKEILYALKNGITVYGSSAMGALRAAELHTFGMRGIGQVYQKFLTQELEDDDEVLTEISKNEENQYVRTSEPMVNLRATFDKALQHKLIGAEDYSRLVSIAKSLHYPKRTFEQIFEQAFLSGIQKDILTPMKRFVAENYEDIQKHDAIELLNTLAQLTPADLDAPPKDIGTYGVFFEVLHERDRKVQQGEYAVPRYYISNYVEFNHPDIENINFRALNRGLVLLLADIFGIQASPEDVEAEIRRFKKKHELTDHTVFATWLRENDLHEESFGELMRDMARIRKTQRWYIMMHGFRENTKELLEELILNNEYPQWKEKAVGREKHLQHHEEEVYELFNNTNSMDLLKDYLQHKKFPWNVSLADAVSEMGIKKWNFILELAKEKFVNEKVDEVLKNIFREEA